MSAAPWIIGGAVVVAGGGYLLLRRSQGPGGELVDASGAPLGVKPPSPPSAVARLTNNPGASVVAKLDDFGTSVCPGVAKTVASIYGAGAAAAAADKTGTLTKLCALSRRFDPTHWASDLYAHGATGVVRDVKAVGGKVGEAVAGAAGGAARGITSAIKQTPTAIGKAPAAVVNVAGKVGDKVGQLTSIGTSLGNKLTPAPLRPVVNAVHAVASVPAHVTTKVATVAAKAGARVIGSATKVGTQAAVKVTTTTAKMAGKAASQAGHAVGSAAKKVFSIF